MSTQRLLHHLLWRAADAAPDGAAVIGDARRLTYAELAQEARRLAALLVDNGVGRGDRVAVQLEKSPGSVVALYAILASGAAYVPIDPDAPPARSATILRDCGARLVVTDTVRAAGWAATDAAEGPLEAVVVPGAATAANVGASARVRILAGDALRAQLPRGEVDTAVESDLAYVLYTSGSTGMPKGVSLTHANAIAFIEWATREFAVTPNDRLASHAPFHFDLSVFDLYGAAWAHASVVLVPRAASIFPRELRAFIEREGITIWYSVPWVLAQLAERAGLRPGDLPELRAVLFAGEAFPARQLRRLMSVLPGARFANLYGPTECNVCTYFDVPQLPDDGHDVPIGTPITGVEVLVVHDGRAVAPGAIGELYVRGPTVMQGYWGDAERTSATLVPNPLEPDAPERWLRTGDLVEVLPGDALRFRGRRDGQVKHRGHRVELGDVEAAVATHPAVSACAAVVVADRRASSRLVVYVERAHAVEAGDLLRSCAELLPRSMIPDEIEFVDTLPRTSTGKTDRRTLSAAAHRSDPNGMHEQS